MNHLTVQDFSSDIGRQLLSKLAHKHELPDYVLSASEEDFRTEGNQSKCAMLLPEPRLPTHTKAATWLSYAQLMEQRNDLGRTKVEDAETYIKKRAKFWGIEADLQRVLDREYALIKEAAVTDEQYPVRNVAEAKAADEWLNATLNESPNEIAFDDRVELARKISKFIEPSGMVKLTTCDRGCYDGKKLASELRKLDNVSTEIESLAKTAEQTPAKELAACHFKVAQYLDRYAPEISRPEIFTVVNTLDDVVFLDNGAVVKTADLRRVNSGAIEAAMTVGDGVYLGDGRQYVDKIASHMTSDLADMLCDDLKRAGIRLEVEPDFRDQRIMSHAEG